MVRSVRFSLAPAGPSITAPDLKDALQDLLAHPELLSSGDEAVELRVLVRSVALRLQQREVVGALPSWQEDEPVLAARAEKRDATTTARRVSLDLQRRELHHTAREALQGIRAAANAIETASLACEESSSANAPGTSSARRQSRRRTRDAFHAATTNANGAGQLLAPAATCQDDPGANSSLRSDSAESMDSVESTRSDEQIDVALTDCACDATLEACGSSASHASASSAPSSITSPPSPLGMSATHPAKSAISPLSLSAEPARTRSQRLSSASQQRLSSRPSGGLISSSPAEINSSSGSAAHVSMLASLMECRARASSATSVTPVVTPRVARRRRRTQEMRRNAMARVIQSAYRRRKAVEALISEKDTSSADFNALLQDLVQSAPRVAPPGGVGAAGAHVASASSSTSEAGPSSPCMLTPPATFPSLASPNTGAAVSSGGTVRRYLSPLSSPPPDGGSPLPIAEQSSGGASDDELSCRLSGASDGNRSDGTSPRGVRGLSPPSLFGRQNSRGDAGMRERRAEAAAVREAASAAATGGGGSRDPNNATAAPPQSLPPPPELDEAKAYAFSLKALQTDRDERPGEYYPLYTSLRTFDRFGTDISQYMHFMFWSARVFFGLFMLNLSNLVINWEGRQLVKDGYPVTDMIPAALTWHTLGNAAIDGVLGKGAHSYAVIEFFTTGVLVIFLFYLRGRFEEIHTRIRNSDGGQALTAADFTLMVSNVPEAWGSQQVREFFERFGEVIHVGFSLDYGELILHIKKAKDLRDRHTENCLGLLQLMGKLATKDKIIKARKQARASLHAVEENDRAIKRLMRARYRCTGYAFVTFNKYSVAQAVLNELPKRLQADNSMADGRVGYLFGGRMRVNAAPEPNDVIWENLQYSSRQQVVRQVISTMICLVFVVVGTIAIFVANLYVAPGVNYSVDSAGMFIVLYLSSIVVLALGHIIVFALVAVLAHTLEKPHTNAGREMSMMVKLSSFMVLNTIINGCLFLFPIFNTLINEKPNYHFTSGWYVTGGTTLMMMILGDIVVVNLGLELFRPGDLIRRAIARKAKTQLRMNELWACPGELLLPFRLCVMCKTIVAGSMFSFAMPVMHMVIAVYLWMGHWVDRYTLLRRVTPPAPHHKMSQMKVVLNVFFPLGIILHSTMAFKYLGDICYRQELVVDDPVEVYMREFDRCESLVQEGGQCVDLLPHKYEQKGFLQSVASMFGDRDSLAKIRGDTELAVGMPLSADDRVDISCWTRNTTAWDGATAAAADEGMVCVHASNAASMMCAQQIEWGGAHIFLIISAVIWSLVVIFFVYTNSSFFYAQQTRAKLEKLRTGTSAHLDLWRFIVQRDVRDPKIKPAPPNAEIRPTARPDSKSGGGGGGGGSSPPRAHDPSKQGHGETASPHQPPQLSAQALMYLPPLTVHLLNSYYENANTSNKMLGSYLQHYVQRPMLDPSTIEQEEIIQNTPRRARFISRERPNTEGAGSDDEGDTPARGRPGSFIDVRSLSSELTDRCSRASHRVVGAGAKVISGTANVGANVYQSGVNAGAASASALRENLRDLKLQLARVEAQLGMRRSSRSAAPSDASAPAAEADAGAGSGSGEDEGAEDTAMYADELAQQSAARAACMASSSASAAADVQSAGDEMSPQRAERSKRWFSFSHQG